MISTQFNLTADEQDREYERTLTQNETLYLEIKSLKRELEDMSNYIKALENDLAIKKAELRGYRAACTGKDIQE